MTDITAQFINLAWMTVFGFWVAVIWDMGQILARKWIKSKICLAVIDFCFCLGAAVTFMQMLLWINDGVLRNYVIIGCLFGVFLYHKLFRH